MVIKIPDGLFLFVFLAVLFYFIWHTVKKIRWIGAKSTQAMFNHRNVNNNADKMHLLHRLSWQITDIFIVSSSLVIFFPRIFSFQNSFLGASLGSENSETFSCTQQPGC